jgi:Na+-translocating ferredoxin:NAD+ oxidoreductase RnfD subunit
MIALRSSQQTPPAPSISSSRFALSGFLVSPKGLLTLLFVGIALVAGASLGWRAVSLHLLAATLGAVALEYVPLPRGKKLRGWPSSAILSGLIVAFVLGIETTAWITILVGALATVSKRVLRLQNGHVFNPAALALLISVPLFGTGQSWWGGLGDAAWPCVIVLLVGGACIVETMNRFPLVLAFLGTYFSMLTGIALMAAPSVSEMFRPPFVNAALFLALFMLTDPPTAPGRTYQQIVIGMFVAIVSVAGHSLGLGESYLLVGLLAGNALLAFQRYSARAYQMHRYESRGDNQRGAQTTV